jgi:hypothetical protein
MAETESCLPDYCSLEVAQAVDVTKDGSFAHTLKSKNIGGIYPTKAVLIGELREGRLQLTISFEAEEGLGLFYNVYAVLVADEKRALFWKDFTEFCRAPGASVSPGHRMELGTIKDLGKGTQEIRIIVWGKKF